MSAGFGKIAVGYITANLAATSLAVCLFTLMFIPKDNVNFDGFSYWFTMSIFFAPFAIIITILPSFLFILMARQNGWRELKYYLIFGISLGILIPIVIAADTFLVNLLTISPMTVPSGVLAGWVFWKIAGHRM